MVTEVVVALKLAATVVFVFIVNEHVPVPEHPPPLHPVNIEPVTGAAVNVTTLPTLYVSLQSDPQFIPVGDEVTVPLPVPLLFMVRKYFAKGTSLE
jgi:hypothetical protein